MSETLRKVRAFIDSNSLLKGAGGVLVGVSGGPDSVALLDLLVELPSPAPLHVAHLDHLLRGRESGDDAKFVRALAKRLRLPWTIDSVDVRAEARKAGLGIEETSREHRYRFLLATAVAEGCDRIATGHTMNDQAETVLMRLARGTGPRGLAGMRPAMPAHLFEGRSEWEGEHQGDEVIPERATAGVDSPASLSTHPLLIRPLLCITREEVEAYCARRGLKFRVDSTNQNQEYTRNRVRSAVLEALREINPHAVEHIAAAAEMIAADQDALDDLAESLLDQARQRGALWDGAAADSTYSVAALLKQQIGMRRRVIIKAIELARLHGDQPEASEQVGRAHVDEVEALMRDGMSGKRVELPGRLEVWREFDTLVLRKPLSPKSQQMADENRLEVEISATSPLTTSGGFNISLVRGQPGDLLKPALEQARRENTRLGHDWMSAVLDDQLLPDKLVVRPRKRGERVLALGRKQTKKLKNLMIDHRIPTSRRAIWPVVATPDGHYVWSPGLPPALKFAARDETHGLAILRASGV